MATWRFCFLSSVGRIQKHVIFRRRRRRRRRSTITALRQRLSAQLLLRQVHKLQVAGEEGSERKVASANREEWNKVMKFALSSLFCVCELTHYPCQNLLPSATPRESLAATRQGAREGRKEGERVKERKGRDQRRWKITRLSEEKR